MSHFRTLLSNTFVLRFIPFPILGPRLGFQKMYTLFTYLWHNSKTVFPSLGINSYYRRKPFLSLQLSTQLILIVLFLFPQKDSSSRKFKATRQAFANKSGIPDQTAKTSWTGGQGRTAKKSKHLTWLKHFGSVIKRQFRRCLTKPRSKPFSVLPAIISKHCLLPTVTRRLASQTRNLFMYT